MFRNLSNKSQSVFLLSAFVMLISVLSACDSQPPKLMKAVKQFDSDKELQAHKSHIRKDHMDLLMHKRDQTMIRGIRTKENSLRACIDCHVPAKDEAGQVMRHDNPQHFCSTCHGYVAASLDCFECHADHPDSANASAKAPDDSIHNQKAFVPATPDKAPVEVAKQVNPERVTGESVSE